MNRPADSSSDALFPDTLRQEQREAILDALHYCMYADNRLVLAEEKVIGDWIGKISWDSPVAFDLYAASSIEKIRRANEEPQSREELVSSIGARLGDAATKALALSLCKRLAAADGVATASELGVINALKLDNHIV